MEHGRFIDIHDHFCTQQATDVTQGILCKGRRSITKTVAHQIVADDFVETTDALLTNLSEVVETGLQFSSALLLSVLRDRL